VLVRLLQGALFFLDRAGPLLGVVVGFVVGVTVHSVSQAFLADRFNDRQARLAGRISVDPRRHFEAFGVVAVLIAGVGWGKPVPFDERRVGRGRYLLLLALGPLTQVALALAAFGGLALLDADSATTRPFVTETLLFFGLVNAASAVLALTPLPPLEGNRLLWTLAPSTGGWQRARFYSEEQNYGQAALIVLLLPIFSGVGLLMRLVYAVSAPLVDLLFRAVGL